MLCIWYIEVMDKKPEFIGRKYPEGLIKRSQDTMKEWRKDALEPFEGEIEKTADDLLMIGTVNDLITEELKKLGFEKESKITPEQIHLMPREVFIKKFPNNVNSKGLFQSTDQTIYINKGEADTRALMISAILHESIHLNSSDKYYRDPEGGISDARVGYRLNSLWKEAKNQNKLKGFNEFMVEFTVNRILERNARLLEERFGITEKDIEGTIYGVGFHPARVKIVETIVKKVAEYRNIDQGKVITDFERGQFSNTILALKDIDIVFGQGSIRILGFLDSFKNREHNAKIEKMIELYFVTEDLGERKKIKEEILSFAD